MESDVSRNIEEQLSAFIDGELPEEELQLLVRRLERDEDYRSTLVRYSTIGNLMRKDPGVATSAHFRARIMAAIDDEAEADVQPDAGTSSSVGWLKPLATVAALAVVAIGVLNSGQFSGGGGPAPEASVAANPAPAATARPALARSAPTNASAAQAARLNRERLTSYMVSHREYAPAFHGPMASSRIFVRQASFEE